MVVLDLRIVEEKPAYARFGVYSENIRAGLTVGEVRKQWGPLWRIPTLAKPWVNKAEVDDDYVLRGNDKLEFTTR
jgi:hypothetical protein